MRQPQTFGKPHFSSTSQTKPCGCVCGKCQHPEPQQPEPVRHSHGHYVRRFLMRINSDRYDLPCLPFDIEGCMFLILMLAWGLPDEEIELVAPWWFRELTDQQRNGIKQAARAFDLTGAKMAKAIRFTLAEYRTYSGMKAYKRVCFRPHDDDEWAAVRQELEQNREDERCASNKRKFERRRDRRRAARAASEAEIAATYSARQAAIMRGIECIRRGRDIFEPTALRIMGVITRSEADRALFPAKAASYRQVFYREVAALTKRGVLRKYKSRGRYLILPYQFRAERPTLNP